jgi:manganese transport system ATP-binding protein
VPASSPPPPSAAVVAVDVRLGYDDHLALAPSSFTITRGSSVALIGPNGSGKSSILRAAAGLLRPQAGRLEVAAATRPGGVALVLQTTEVDRTLPMTVGEAVAMGRYPHLGLLGRTRPTDRSAVERAMERMDVGELRRRQIHELSGGQRQRVLVAQGLAQEADLLLLDEPVTGLDVVSRTLIDQAVDEEVAARRTVLTTTHDLADARRADLVLLLANRLVAVGPPTDVLTADHLRDAYGGRLVTMGGDVVLLDDPHHGHAHSHPGGPRTGAAGAEDGTTM